MRMGIVLSGVLHLTLVGLAVVGLPRWFRPEPVSEQAIPVEFIAEVAERRAVPAAPPPPEPVAEEAKLEPPPEPIEEEPEVEPPPPEPAPVEAPEPEPPQQVATLEPEPPPEPPPPEPPKVAAPAPIPAPAPKAKPKPPRKPEPKTPAKQPKQEDFLDRMKQVVAKHEPEPPPPPRAPAARSALETVANRLTMSEEDAVRRHIIRCWNPPVGARDAQDMEVRIVGTIRRDGVVQQVDVVADDKARMQDEPFFRAFAESAMRAFYKCQRLPLPPEKYDSWKNFDIGFNLRDMLGG
jgi:outer membrane biosynthesis protein TonB